MPQEITNITFSDAAKGSIDQLRAMMDRVRIAYRSSQPVNELFSHDEILLFNALLVTLFAEAELKYVLIESGIPTGDSFSGESLRIIKSSILPYVYDELDLRLVIKKIFHHPKDIEIISALIEQFGNDWIASNAALLLPDSLTIQTRLENAAKVISYRIAAIGMEDEIAARAGKDETLITPFLEQNKEINELLGSLERKDRIKADEDYTQSIVMLHQCQDNLKSLDRAAAENGTSLRQTYLLRKASLLIDRLICILSLIHEIEDEQKIQGFCMLIRDTILFEIKPGKLRDFISNNIQVIAYRITENKRKTGEHYITTDRHEYFDMFVSACGGGFIVSFMVIIKLMMHYAELPPLWEGIAYSLNYAIGFVIVHLLNFTIATKQPAMTAAYIAASLDNRDPKDNDYHDFAVVIAAVSRSQIVSFAGNLLVVFPFSLCWMLFINVIFGDHLLTPTASEKMLSDIHPIFSLSVLYAALAGAYLFMAGLVSGFGDNKVMVSKISLRIQHHPWLIRHLSPQRLDRLAAYSEKNLGPIMGNIVVGFMLGMTAFFGHITGLPLDIRHVTFSAGNFALGLLGSHFHVSTMDICAALSGLFLIGVVNFLVSFTLALQIALRSRSTKLRNYPYLLRSVLIYFRHHPREFFYPPATTSVATTEPITPNTEVLKH